MPSNWISVRVCVRVLLFVWLSPTCSELIWFDWFARIFSMFSRSLSPNTNYKLVIRPFDSFVTYTLAKTNRSWSDKSVRACLCICPSVIRVTILYICEKFLKLAIFFLLSFAIVCWMFIELAIGNCFVGLRFLRVLLFHTFASTE